MPPRIPLLAAIRRPPAFLGAPAAQLSTSQPLQLLRHDVQSPSPNSPPSNANANDNANSTTSSASPSLTSAILEMESASQQQSQQPQQRQQPMDATSAVSGLLYGQLARNQQAQARARGPSWVGGGQGQRGDPNRNRRVEEELRTHNTNDDYARQMTRRWRPGDVYAPHDLSPSEMGKWRRSTARKRDLVDLLGLNPLDMYRNFSVISEFMTPHGRIKRSADTGLRPVNQRKMAKAIRRAIGLGLHPSVHQHPEILARDPVRRPAQNQPSQYQHRI
ncbi:hypothetical protein DL765_004138 [Monosporascus sp. GIB2]|nr:hypothetical protein DL765_004138 [Monosporascus sp. GIB2]